MPYAKPPRQKDGREYGVTSGWIWRTNWWNFYERGQSFADGGFLADAEQDFRWAIERRDGDQRKARTYGMHLLDDYFPHRELGIALYRQQRWEEAQRELLTSLEQTESARAKFYLNEVRREILRRKTKGPRRAPTITIDAPRDGFATAEPFVWVTGTADSDAYVEALDLNGERPRIELARKRMPFRARVPLAPGTNVVRVGATDLLGASGTRVLRVRADRSGPAVGIRDIRELGPGGALDFVAEVEDESGLAELTVGGRTVAIASGSNGTQAVRTTVAQPADGRLAVVAVDRIGNRTEATIVLSGSGAARSGRPGGSRIAATTAGSSPGAVLLASADPLPAPLVSAARALGEDGASGAEIPSADAPYEALLAAPDPAQELLLPLWRGALRRAHTAPSAEAAALPSGPAPILFAQASPASTVVDAPAPTVSPSARRAVHEIAWRLGEVLAPTTDRAAPLVDLFGFERDEPLTVYLDRIFVTGNAHDEGGVTRIAVNDKPIARARGRDVLFSTILPLEVGDNLIRVTATDATGKASTRELRVRREQPAIRDPKIRLAVVPMPFKQGELIGDLSEPAQGYLLEALTDQRRYRVLERQQLSKIMREQSLNATDLVDQDYAIELGNLAAADGVLVGRIYRRTGSVEAWVQLVDTETSEVLASADIFGEESDLAGVEALMRGLAQKVALAIPIIEEPIVSVDDDEATIAKGTTSGLRPSLRVALFRRSADTDYTVVGLGRTLTAEALASRIQMLTSDALLRAGDIVVVR